MYALGTVAERAKPCSKCGKEKPLSEYYRHPTAPDGRQAEMSFLLLSRHSNDRPFVEPHSLRSLHARSVARGYIHLFESRALKAGLDYPPTKASPAT
jgi:hypothetical protein